LDPQHDGLRHPWSGAARIDEIGDERQEVETPTVAGDVARGIAKRELLPIRQAGKDGARVARMLVATSEPIAVSETASTASATTTSISVKPAELPRD